MATCGTCGKELKKDAKFCKACGEEAGSDRGARKARVLAAEKSGRKQYVIFAVAAAALVAGWFILSAVRGSSGGMPVLGGGNSVSTTVYAPVSAMNGEVRIPMNALQGTKAGYFVYKTGGRDIRFFLVKASDGTVRAALDACTSCYHAKRGYRQEGETMVCNNCGLSFRSTDVGTITGGCSPIPVQKRTDGQLLVLQVKELEDGAKYF